MMMESCKFNFSIYIVTISDRLYLSLSIANGVLVRAIEEGQEIKVGGKDCIVSLKRDPSELDAFS